MKTFKDRLLTEDYMPQAYGGESKPSLGQRLKSGAKNNWGKLATGAALGATGAMLGHQFSDGMADFNNDLHQAADTGGLTGWKDELLTKTQHGLDGLKSDGAHSSGSGTSTSASTESGNSWASKSTFGSNPNPSSGTGSSTSGITPEQLKATGIKYAGANDSYNGQISGIVGSGYADHLKGYLSGDVRVDPSELTDAQAAQAKYLTAGDQSQVLNKYQDALKNASADGKITTSEANNLDKIKQELDTITGKVNSGFMDRITGADKVNDYTHQKLVDQLKDSVAYAKDNNLGFLLNGNTDDDLQFFKDLEYKYGKIPDKLQPIYQAVIRSRQG